MRYRTNYLSVSTKDMSELADILLNMALSWEQQSRAQGSYDELDPSSVLIAYTAVQELADSSIPSCRSDSYRIKIEKLIFGQHVSTHKADLANLLLALASGYPANQRELHYSSNN